MERAIIESTYTARGRVFNRDCMRDAVNRCIQQCRFSEMSEQMWGTEIKKGVLTSLQIILIEKGVDWIPQLGGRGSPIAVNYSCKNDRCRCIPIRADRWMRFATSYMRALNLEEFKLLIDKMNQGPGMGLTEETFKGAHVITNPEWR